MSSSLNAYLVDLASLEQVIASGRTELVPQIQQSWLNLAETPADRDESPDESEPLLDAIVRQIILGVSEQHAGLYNESDPSLAWGLAMERIVNFLGERLETQYFRETRYSYLQAVQYVLPLVERGLPVSTPLDFGPLAAGYLRRDECRTIEIDLNHPEPVVRAGRDEFADWCEAAASEDLDLVAFWY